MININMYGAPKGDTSGLATVSQVILNRQSTANEFEPHYIWGQLFNDKEDIDGDIKVNGFGYIDHIKTLDVLTDDVQTTNIDTTYITTKYAKANKLTAGSIDAEWINIIKGYINDLATKNITTENLTVTKSAHFFELIIDQIKASGGAVIFTPANGFSIRKVDKINGGYRLYFLAKDRGNKITNMWRKDDQAICQNFNKAGTGTNYNVSNKYYWSLVLNTNNEEMSGEPININVGTIENIDIQPCHYIDISDSEFDGTLDPDVDDEIVMLGYRGDDVARQNAIYISSYSSLDDELQAPLFVQYKGINDFNLGKHKYTWFSGGLTVKGELNGIQANEIRGSLRVTDGKTVDDKLNELNTYISSVKFSADENMLAIGKINGYIGELRDQMDNNITWSYIQQHADEINMQVIDGLKQTGIDIKSGKIVMNADNTTFLGNISMYNSDNGLTIYDDNSSPRVVLSREQIQKEVVSGWGYDYVPNNINKISKKYLNMDDYCIMADYWSETKASQKARYLNNIKGYYLGNFSADESFTLNICCTLRFCQREEDGGNVYDVPSLWQNDKGTYKMNYKIYCGNHVVAEYQTDIPKRLGVEVTVDCQYSGDYYLDWTIDYQYDIDKVAQGYTYRTISESFMCWIIRGAKGVTFIGTNGMYTSQNSNRYLVYSTDGLKVSETAGRNITIGTGNRHLVESVKYAIGVEPEKGPYWNYEDATSWGQTGPSWTVPFGVPKLITLYDSDFVPMTISDSAGNPITVRGYNVNSNIFCMIQVGGSMQDFDHYIVLPYAEPGSVMIYNYSNRNIFIHARGNTDYNSNNIYINAKVLYFNGGMWRYEMGQTDECLWMIGDRFGWKNLSLIDR